MAKFEIVIDNLAVFVGEQKARPESLLPISFTIEGKTLDNATGDIVRKAHQDGLSVRSQITPKDSTLMLEKLLDEGKDVLLLSVSSGICESFATAKYIAKGLGIKYPKRKIVVIDTLSCGAGEGLLWSLACKLQQEGLELEQVAEKIEAAKQRLHHVFVTTDFSALASSSIISQTAVVNIKPIFDVSSEGKVFVLQKTMGTKKALGDIVKYVASTLAKDVDAPLVITYGDVSGAKALADSLKEKVAGARIECSSENEFVSAYIGQEAVCICFFGEQRRS